MNCESSKMATVFMLSPTYSSLISSNSLSNFRHFDTFHDPLREFFGKLSKNNEKSKQNALLKGSTGFLHAILRIF